MTQPTPSNPFPAPWPTGPRTTIGDPTGLRYDRGDLDEEPTATPLPAGVDGFATTGRGVTVQVKACCGAVLASERCDCQEINRQVHSAPVIVMPAFNLRQLREQHATAAELERGAA